MEEGEKSPLLSQVSQCPGGRPHPPLPVGDVLRPKAPYELLGLGWAVPSQASGTAPHPAPRLVSGVWRSLALAFDPVRGASGPRKAQAQEMVPMGSEEGRRPLLSPTTWGTGPGAALQVREQLSAGSWKASLRALSQFLEEATTHG